MPIALSYRISKAAIQPGCSGGKIYGVSLAFGQQSITVVTAFICDAAAATAEKSATSSNDDVYVKPLGNELGSFFVVDNVATMKPPPVLISSSSKWAVVIPCVASTPGSMIQESSMRAFRAENGRWVEDKVMDLAGAIQQQQQQQHVEGDVPPMDITQLIKEHCRIVQCEVNFAGGLHSLNTALNNIDCWSFLFPGSRLVKPDSGDGAADAKAGDSSQSDENSMKSAATVANLDHTASTIRRDYFQSLPVRLLVSPNAKEEVHGICIDDDDSSRDSQTNWKGECAVNALVLVSPTDLLQDVGRKLQIAIKEQMEFFLNQLRKVPSEGTGRLRYSFISFTPSTFLTPVLVSRLLARNDKGLFEEFLAEDFSKHQRRIIHGSLLLAPSKPLFRLGASNEIGILNPASQSNLPLISPHIVPSTGKAVPRKQVIKGAQPSDIEDVFVNGPYRYYHYMMQNVNDKGWGCAYRSLQTIMSWFQMNYYTSKDPLTIKEIQSTIVRLGMEDNSFIGSRKWIGSQEVGWVLDDVIGASCRFETCSSAEDVMAVAGKIADHFKIEGTPILISGNNLALTLVGLAWNKKTREPVSFLIVDPHYVGQDDLADVQAVAAQMEGYKAIPCGWRTLGDTFTFKQQGVPYMLCFPRCPSNVI